MSSNRRVMSLLIIGRVKTIQVLGFKIALTLQIVGLKTFGGLK